MKEEEEEVKEKMEEVCMMCTQFYQVIEAQKREINLLQDTITAVKSNMGIVLDQSDTTYNDVNERWAQPLKVEVDENVKAKVDQGQPGQVEQSAKIAMSKGGLHIHLH